MSSWFSWHLVAAALLIGLTLLILPLSWYVLTIEPRRQLIAEIQARGGRVFYEESSLTMPKAISDWFPLECDREVSCVEMGPSEYPEALLAAVAQVPELEVLAIDKMDLSKVDVSHLQRLPAMRAAQINRSTVDAKSLGALGKCVSLEALHLVDCHYTVDAPKGLGALNELRRLSLNGKTVKDKLLTDLPRLKNLVELDLMESGVSDDGLKHVAAISNLVSLDLTLSEVKGPGLRHLVSLLHLDQLELAQLPIHDGDAALLPQIPALRYLDMTNTRISESSIEQLAKKPDLTFFDATSPNISVEGWKKWKNRFPALSPPLEAAEK